MIDGRIVLGTVPARSTLEMLDDGSVFAFLPDGSSKRFSIALTKRGITPITDHFPPIKITAKKR